MISLTITITSQLRIEAYLAGSSEPGRGGVKGWGGAGPHNNCRTVVCFFYNSVLNENTMGSPPTPNMNFVPTALVRIT